MLRRKIIALSMVMALVASCGAKDNGESNVNANDKETDTDSLITAADETDTGEDDAGLSIEKITWEKENGIVNGDRTLKFVCRNNSEYRLRSVAVEFVQKPDTTVEMLKNEFGQYIEAAELSLDDDYVKNMYLYGYVADEMKAGETKEGYFSINGSFASATGDHQYDLFEPDIMTIRYYKDETDDSETVVYYDYKDGKYYYGD